MNYIGIDIDYGFALRAFVNKPTPPVSFFIEATRRSIAARQ
jgi:hypothetical protein